MRKAILFTSCRAHRRAAALLLLLGCVLALDSFGLSPASSLRQFVLRTWTSAQGLPQNSIRTFLQTRDGFLWIGTLGGLARFDGTSFVVYKSGAPNSIPNDQINGLSEDLDGSLWIGSPGGLTRYRNGRFHTYGSQDGLPDSSIWRMCADTTGGVWGVTRRSELFHFDGRTVHRYSWPMAGHIQAVNALIEDGEGVLWIATFNGLYALDQRSHLARFALKDGLAGERVYALALDRRGDLWTAGDGGLTHHGPHGFIAIAVPGLTTATLLAFDPTDQGDTVWTGATGRGLFRSTTRGLQRMGVAQGLISDELYMLYCSRDGSLWLGAIGGLNQLSDGTVTSYGSDEGLPARPTLYMQRFQGADRGMWFGVDKALFQVRDGTLAPLRSERTAAKRGSPDTMRDPLDGRNAVSVCVRSTYGSSRGLVLSDRSGNSVLSDGTRTRTLPRIPWRSVGAMLIDRHGMIWVGGSEIGVVAYPAHGPPHSYTTANGLDVNNVLSLAEDAAGTIWVGTISGLDRIRDGVATHVFSSGNVNAIDPLTDGSVWAGSDSGLIYVPPSAAGIRLFTRRDNLPTNVIEGVAADAEGYLWLGTEQGAFRVSKADLLASDGHPHNEPIMFGVDDGFRNLELRINSVFRSREGDIWFVTLNELAKIDPRKIRAESLAPLVVDGIDLDDGPTLAGPVASFAVPAGRHRLTIRFALPEFRMPSRIRFRYRLEGWDKDWIDPGILNAATYTALPPGNYTFRVIHSDGYGDWNPVESSLPVKVLPYFYQTGWFAAFVVLLAVAGTWQLHRLRVAQVSSRINARMQERLQERTRIARELHDTLLQGIIGVSMQTYAASQQAGASASVSSMLGNVSQRLRDIAEQSREAVDGLRSPAMATKSLETMLALILHEVNLAPRVRSQVNSVGIQIHLRPTVQREVEQIAREAIANVAQHSEAGLVRIDITYHPAHFFLSVSDNGRGIDAAAHTPGYRGHWGIAGMRERAEAIGGRLRILPNHPNGTVVEISLPGALAYVERQRTGKDSIWRRLPWS